MRIGVGGCESSSSADVDGGAPNHEPSRETLGTQELRRPSVCSDCVRLRAVAWDACDDMGSAITCLSMSYSSSDEVPWLSVLRLRPSSSIRSGSFAARAASSCNRRASASSFDTKKARKKSAACGRDAFLNSTQTSMRPGRASAGSSVCTCCVVLWDSQLSRRSRRRWDGGSRAVTDTVRVVMKKDDSREQ